MTTRKEAIELFHKAGEITGWKPGIGNDLVLNYLTVFADLARAKENEACAEVCAEIVAAFEQEAKRYDYGDSLEYHNRMEGAEKCLEAIRARMKP